MPLNLIMKHKPKNKLIFFILTIIWVISLIFSLIGATVGTPWDGWLQSKLAKEYAAIYFVVIVALGFGVIFIRKMFFCWYICVITLFWLFAFWNVPALYMPALSKFINVVVFIVVMLWAFSPSGNEKSSS